MRDIDRQVVANDSVLGTPIRPRITEVFERHAGKTIAEEDLFEILGKFLKVLPQDLYENRINAKDPDSWLPKVAEALVKILIQDKATQERALEAIRNTPEPQEGSGKHRQVRYRRKYT